VISYVIYHLQYIMMTYLLQTASLSCIQQRLLGRLAYEKTE